jgi:5'-3' exonuclease
MKKITLVDANNWFRRYMYSDNFLAVDSMIADLASLTPTYLVWDGFNGNAKRREIYPDYKKARKEKDKDTDFETLNMIRKDLICYLPACSIYADGYEGDDVINHLCERLSVYEDTEFEIISTDKDLAAVLPNSSRVSNPLVSEKFLSLVERREWIPLYKTLVGDPSDCISGMKGFGNKSWEKMTEETKNNLLDCFKNSIVPDDEKIAQNFDELKKMWAIVNFLPIDNSELKIVGSIYDLEKIREILKEKGAVQ